MTQNGERLPGGRERRRSPRVPMPVEGGVVSVVGARLIDVSIHGMAIEALVPLETESVHRFRLVAAGRRLDVDARVASCRPRAGERRIAHLIGMEFRGLSSEAQQHLAEVLGQTAEI